MIVSQVALSKAGYHCGGDEMRWWLFGNTCAQHLLAAAAAAAAGLSLLGGAEQGGLSLR
jgi:hypothetical protein